MIKQTVRYRLLHDGKIVGVGYSMGPAHREYRIAQAHGEDYACQWLFPQVPLSYAKEWEQEELQKLRAQGVTPIPQLKPLPPQKSVDITL